MKRIIRVLTLFLSLTFGFSQGAFAEQVSIPCGSGVYGLGNYTIQLPEGKVIDGKSCVGRVVIDNRVREIGTSAFENSGITTILLPETLEIIGPRAFARTKSLFHIEFPDSLKLIQWSAFYQSGLFTAKFGKSISRIESLAFVESRLSTVSLPDSIVEIGDFSFASNSIYSIDLGVGLSRIGEYAFSDNHISEVVLPDGIKEIGRGAFFKQNIDKFVGPEKILYCGPLSDNEIGIRESQNPRGGWYIFTPNSICPRKEAEAKKRQDLEAAQAFEKRVCEARKEQLFTAEESLLRAIKTYPKSASTLMRMLEILRGNIKSDCISQLTLESVRNEVSSAIRNAKSGNATKKITITCINGKLTKKVTGVNPKCPAGYKKR